MRKIMFMAAFCGAALTSLPAHAASTSPTWAGAWGYAPADSAPNEPEQPAGTYRYRVRLSQAGDAMQLTLSNAEGDRPLAVSSMTIASPSGPAGTEIGANPVQAIRFSGSLSVTLPRGETLVSDPVNAPFRLGQDVIVSVTLATPSRPGRTNLGIEMAFAPTGANSAFAPIKVRPYLSLVSVRSAAAPCTVVAFGDSITDGYLALSTQTRGWPGRLAERFAGLPAARRCGVVNMGISGNRVLKPGRATSALDRFWRDVASVPNVTHVIFLEGINDIGNAPESGPDALTPEHLLFGYRQFVARAHALGIKVVGATLTPALRAGYMSPAKEKTRQAVNAAIRSGKIFDGVVDFDAAVRDPAKPADLRAAFDPGDHLHPNDAGLRAMGDAVSLDLFKP